MNAFSRSRRALFGLLPAPLLVTVTAARADENEKAHRLALHIDERDEAKMNLVLNNAVNVSDFYTAKAEEIEIEIVAYGPGLHMLRTDTAPSHIQERIKSFAQSMPAVTFSACDNTRIGMAKSEGKKPEEIPLARQAKIVPAGVVRLMELQELGWTYVKP